MTNELGHSLNTALAVPNGKYGGITLGAYRRGKYITWVPGATIDVWTACARMESVTGVPFPHCYFIQTIGSTDGSGGSIHCPPCRGELAALRAKFKTVSVPAKGQQLRLF